MSRRKHKGNNNGGLNKQGLRDLNYIKAPPAGIRLADLPSAQFCKHENAQRQSPNGAGFCPDCQCKWNWKGQLDLGIE